MQVNVFAGGDVARGRADGHAILQDFFTNANGAGRELVAEGKPGRHVHALAGHRHGVAGFQRLNGHEHVVGGIKEQQFGIVHGSQNLRYFR